jgi:hypothetical protein
MIASSQRSRRECCYDNFDHTAKQRSRSQLEERGQAIEAESCEGFIPRFKPALKVTNTIPTSSENVRRSASVSGRRAGTAISML